MRNESEQFSILREAVHSIGEALSVLDKTVQREGNASNSEPYQKLEIFIKNLLDESYRCDGK
jgi:hypothetical protein